MWSIGCILAELWTGTVLFQNDSSQSLLARVIGIIGRIPKRMMDAGKTVDLFFINKDSQELFTEIDSAAAMPSKGRLLQILVPKKTSLFQRMRVEDEDFLNFLSQLLQIDPDVRISATDALKHPWITRSKYSDGL
jgi:serine/threonine protein kinase